MSHRKKSNALDPIREPSGSAAGLPIHRQLRFLLSLASALLLIGIFILSGPSFPSVLYRLLTDGPLLCLWMLSAGGYGSLIPIQSEFRSMKLVTAVALGLGILSTLTLLLGLLGAATTLFIWILILIGAALAIVRLLRAQKEATQVSPLQVPLTSYLYLALIPLAAMVIVAAFVPPGILWGDEPHGYDVLSYHLQLPREWYEAHRITTSTRNAFSFMPLSVETHYLIAMHLRGGPWAGMYLAQLMHVAFCALCAFAIHAFTRSKTATIAFAATPWLALLAPVAYNEGGLLLYATLAIGWTLHALRDLSLRAYVLAGVFTGLACTTKLTAVPTLAVAIPIAAVAASFKPNLRGFLLLFLTSTLTVSPWLIRTAATARNPIFPEAQNLFGRSHFAENQSERWRLAHSPLKSQQSVAARLRAFIDQVLIDWRYAYLLIPLALFAAALTRNHPSTRFLLTLLILLTLFWLTFTHLQSRFFILSFPIAAFLIAQIPTPRVAAIAIGAIVFVSTICIATKFTQQVTLIRNAQALGMEDFRVFLPEFMVDAINGSAPIALAGDARAFRYPAPMSRLYYRTVFDVDAKPLQSIIDAWIDGAPPNSIVIVDPVELDRFSKTYYAIWPIPQDLKGPRDTPFILYLPAR